MQAPNLEYSAELTKGAKRVLKKSMDNSTNSMSDRRSKETAAKEDGNGNKYRQN